MRVFVLVNMLGFITLQCERLETRLMWSFQGLRGLE
jgi:hypothetical protein